MRNRLDEQLELLNTELIRMGALCEDGIAQAAKVLVTRDEALRRAVEKADDEVDALFNKVKSEIIALIAEKPEEGETCLDLLMVAKYFERIGDHAVNIAEWVVFSLTGEHD